MVSEDDDELLASDDDFISEEAYLSHLSFWQTVPAYHLLNSSQAHPSY